MGRAGEKIETYLIIFPDMNLSRTKIDQFKSLAAHVSQLFPAMWTVLVQKAMIVTNLQLWFILLKANYFDNRQRKVQK